MGTKIHATSGGTFAPTANIKQEGATLKGTLLGARDVKTKFGMKPVYKLRVIDGECTFSQGGKEVSPEVGAEVEFFAPTLLHNQLAQVPVGKIVDIKYLGLGKSSKGNAPHTFDVTMEG